MCIREVWEETGIRVRAKRMNNLSRQRIDDALADQEAAVVRDDYDLGYNTSNA